MRTYHKIQTVFKRDPENDFKTLLEGEFSIPEFEYLKDNVWEFTEKVDGTNIRILWNGEDEAASLIPGFCIKGKTDKADTPSFLMEKLIEIFSPLKDEFEETFKDTPVCLYGEGYGAKIQKGGGNYRKDNGFVLFDIKIGRYWLKREDIEGIAARLGLEIAPIIGHGNLSDLVELVRTGFNSKWGDFPAEGVVARPVIELLARNGERIITKLKHKDFTS